ncbi:hypothetical protein TSOC_001232 [Tetrabaena socialis]|uniref:Uncharacterized protein n=1 Tax=Tetrabaena socialis TaxID=47790 RepID=A0A2J8AH87_9CHLO|nr:hypothetical protein TSOC_001232 [Tetrabaena socialis]|eukprot:PNH11880.1 hypothetical protein TSOC_001232 [Tetrabaena socialis]
MLLGECFPYGPVCSVHLFKYVWRLHVKTVLGVVNINNVKNGLLLLRPLAEAFDNGYLIFECKGNTLVARWLGGKQHDHLLISDLSNYPWKSNENVQQDQQVILRGPFKGGVKCFKDLDGKALTFKTDVRPYKRCLAFQATQAIEMAVAEGRINVDWCSGKNFSAHSPAAANIEMYYSTIPKEGFIPNHACLGDGDTD